MNDILQAISSSQSMTHISTTQVIISLVLAFLLSRILLINYFRVVENPLPPKSITVHITMITLVTTMVIIPISSNAILSLGMVGALSVVRFRTAIKSPTDTAFVYWGIAIGIALGAGFYMPAIVSTILISLLMEANRLLSTKTKEEYIINITYDISFEESIFQQLSFEYSIISRVQKNQTVFFCICIPSEKELQHIRELKNIQQSEIVSYKGDFVQ